MQPPREAWTPHVSIYVEVVEMRDRAWMIRVVDRVDTDATYIVVKEFDVHSGDDRKSREERRDKAAAWGRKAAKGLDVKCHVRPLQREKSADNQSARS